MALNLSNEEVLAELYRRLERRKIASYRPYGHPQHPLADKVTKPWQLDFHNAGASHWQRMLMAANRTGKTYCAAAEMAYHLTGEYPDWWQGRRFDKAIRAWACAITNETSRDIQQSMLLGEPVGTGLIPGDNIDPKDVHYKQAGVSNVVDYVRVKHKSGKKSVLTFKTYDQGWRKFQGPSLDLIWMDEEPDANNSKEAPIFTECLTRVLDCQGMIYVTFTPLLGETEMVRHFTRDMEGVTKLISATWDDAPHLDEQTRRQLLESYSEHERDARTQGIPKLGTGRVFMVRDEDISIAPFEVPSHYFRICGVDFGIDHPGAAVWLAIDRDQDIWYVIDGYRQSSQTPVYHAEAIKARGKWIPVAWPHDGLQRGKSDGEPLYKEYLKHGANMLPISARYERDKGGAQPVEPIFLTMNERMLTGRFKVFAHLSDWFEEFRSLHRDDKGKIVAVRDDMLKATAYAGMMERYALQPIAARARPREAYSAPMLA